MMPERGERIHGYTLLQDFTTTSGGNGMWSFAERGGREFFIKEFLSPTYSDESSPGSAGIKREKMIRCRRFERRHMYLWRVLQKYADDGYGLVVTRDFFRWGRKYYKVTDKVEVAGIDIEDVYKLPAAQKKSILIGATLALRLLHRILIVHGDVKPANVLINRSSSGAFRTRLIDFDNSYTCGHPPPAEDLVGDLVYFSPETSRYIDEESGTQRELLTCASDVFSLGLMYCQYLTGRLPEFDQRRYQYAWAAVENGQLLRAPAAIGPEALRSVIERMLLREPGARPTIEDVFAVLRVADLGDARSSVRRREPPDRPPGHRVDGPESATHGGPLGRIADALSRALDRGE